MVGPTTGCARPAWTSHARERLVASVRSAGPAREPCTVLVARRGQRARGRHARTRTNGFAAVGRSRLRPHGVHGDAHVHRGVRCREGGDEFLRGNPVRPLRSQTCTGRWLAVRTPGATAVDL